jgi:hypothetical protein
LIDLAGVLRIAIHAQPGERINKFIDEDNLMVVMEGLPEALIAEEP